MKKLKRILLDDLEQLSAAEAAKYVGGTGGNPPYIPPLITSSNYDYTTSFPPLGSSSSSGWSMSGSSSGWSVSGSISSSGGGSVTVTVNF